MPEAPVTEQCDYDKSWAGRCKSEAVADGRCAEHHGIKCQGCGKPAIRSCDHTGIQFVCGAPLCAGCMHHPPAPDSPNLFGMGGGHAPTSEAIKAWEKTWK